MEEKMERKDGNFEINLYDLWKIFLRCWWIILAAAVVLAAGTYLFLRVTHKNVYTTEAKIWVMREKTGDVKSTADVSIANNIIQDVIDAAANNYDVHVAVMEETGDLINTSKIHVSADKESHVVKIAVTSRNAEESYLLANSLLNQTCNKINELMEGEYTKAYSAVQKPTEPSNAISKARVLLIGLVGAVLVYVVFFMLYIFDDKINSADDVTRYLDISVLGQIPNRRDIARRRSRYGDYYASFVGTDSQGGAAK